MQAILVGLLILAGGVALIRFSQTLVEFGRVPWAERNLGSTRNMYLLAGFVASILGVMMITGIVKLQSDPTATGGLGTSTTTKTSTTTTN